MGSSDETLMLTRRASGVTTRIFRTTMLGNEKCGTSEEGELVLGARYLAEERLVWKFEAPPPPSLIAVYQQCGRGVLSAPSHGELVSSVQHTTPVGRFPSYPSNQNYLYTINETSLGQASNIVYAYFVTIASWANRQIRRPPASPASTTTYHVPCPSCSL